MLSAKPSCRLTVPGNVAVNSASNREVLEAGLAKFVQFRVSVSRLETQMGL